MSDQSNKQPLLPAGLGEIFEAMTERENAIRQGLDDHDNHMRDLLSRVPGVRELAEHDVTGLWVELAAVAKHHLNIPTAEFWDQAPCETEADLRYFLAARGLLETDRQETPVDDEHGARVRKLDAYKQVQGLDWPKVCERMGAHGPKPSTLRDWRAGRIDGRVSKPMRALIEHWIDETL